MFINKDRNCQNSNKELNEQIQENDVEKKMFIERDNDIEPPKWYHIDTEMIGAKLVFFSHAAALFSYLPFTVAFLNSIGLNKSDAGFIMGFRKLGAVVGAPFWGLIADKFQARGILFLVLVAASNLLLYSQLLVSITLGNESLNRCPIPLSNINKNSTANLTQSYRPDKLPSINNISGISNRIIPTENNNNSQVTLKLTETERKKLFSFLLPINIVMMFFEGSIVSLIDSAILQKIQMSSRKIEYGKQRSVGTLGIAVSTALSSTVISNFPKREITCYAGMFFMSTFWNIFSLIASYFLFGTLKYPEQSKQTLETNKTYHKSAENRNIYIKNLKKICLKLDVMMLMVISIFFGMLTALFKNFLYVYLKELNASSLLLSISMGIPFALTFFTLYFGRQIEKFLGGTWKAVAFVFCIFSLRYFIISLLKNPWYALITEASNAMTTPIFIVAGMHHVSLVSPPMVITTMCMFFNTCHSSIGDITGSIVAGILYDQYNGRIMYRTFAGLASILFVIVCFYILWQRLTLWRSRKSTEKDEKSSLNVP